MDSTSWLSLIRSNANWVADAARTAGMDVAVPTCDGWTVADRVTHLGGVYRWAGGVLETGAQTDPGPFPEPPSSADLMGWYDDGVRQILDALAAVDPDQPVWNWAAGAPAPAGFWLRRMAHETIVHRVDAEAAAGRPGAVEPPEVAADGLDEYLDFLRTSAWTFGERLGDLRGGLAFVPTDVPRVWHVDFTADGIAVHPNEASPELVCGAPPRTCSCSLTTAAPSTTSKWTATSRSSNSGGTRCGSSNRTT